MAFQPLSSQASLFIRFRLAAFGLGAGVPHPLSNLHMTQTFADFTWLDLTFLYFTPVGGHRFLLVAVYWRRLGHHDLRGLVNAHWGAGK